MTIDLSFERWIEQKFGPEQSGVSPEAYEWMLEAWKASAQASAIRGAELCQDYARAHAGGKGHPAEMARICAAGIRCL